MKYSIEKLVHFQCENEDCKKWFSIGDAPLDRNYFCPWCGNIQMLFEAEPMPLNQELSRAVAVERERCARIVESYCGAWHDGGFALAASIRMVV